MAQNKPSLSSEEEAIIYGDKTEEKIKALGKELVFRSKGDCFQRAVAHFDFIKIIQCGNKVKVWCNYYPRWILCYYDKVTKSHSLNSPPPIKLKLKFLIKEGNLVLKKHWVTDTAFDPTEKRQACLQKKCLPFKSKK